MKRTKKNFPRYYHKKSKRYTRKSKKKDKSLKGSGIFDIFRKKSKKSLLENDRERNQDKYKKKEILVGMEGDNFTESSTIKFTLQDKSDDNDINSKRIECVDCKITKKEDGKDYYDSMFNCGCNIVDDHVRVQHSTWSPYDMFPSHFEKCIKKKGGSKDKITAELDQKRIHIDMKPGNEENSTRISFKSKSINDNKFDKYKWDCSCHERGGRKMNVKKFYEKEKNDKNLKNKTNNAYIKNNHFNFNGMLDCSCDKVLNNKNYYTQEREECYQEIK